MYPTSDGGLIVGGRSLSDSSFQKTQNSKGYSDYWVVKLDSNKHIQWDRAIGGDSDDYGTAVQQTSDGGYILGGHSYSNISGDKTQDSHGDGDYWIVKLDSSGKVQWDKTIGGSGDDNAEAVREIKKNEYVVDGWSNSPISGDKTGGTRGREKNFDYWLVELKYIKPDTVALTQVQTKYIGF